MIVWLYSNKLSYSSQENEMPTTLRLLCTLILTLSFLLQVYCSFDDVTSKVSISSADGLVAAFGDFDGDKSTDVFVITNQGKQLEVLIWNIGTQKFSNPKVLVLLPRVIVNVAPGDFDGDGCIDVLITTEAGEADSRNVQPKKVYVFWGNLSELSKIKDSFKLVEDLKDQPVILDVNGDLIPDFLGTIYNKGNVSLEKRTYWISEGKNKTFKSQTQKINSKSKEQSQELSPLRIPHSNGFLDLTGDMTADLFVTSHTKEGYTFEIWDNKEGVLTYPHKIIGLPHGVSASSHVIGQSSFADFDGDGKIDHLLPVCSLPNCKDSQLYVYVNNKWSRILANNHDTWQFIPPSSNGSISSVPLMTLRIGDYNMDGYPDGIIILDIVTPVRIKRTPVLLQNVPCSTGANCVKGRTFSVQWKSLMSLQGAVLATFYDIFENGIIDFIIVTQSSDRKFKIHAVRNDLNVDASFIKVVVLSGATITSCSKGKMPYGVNQAGPYVRYSMTGNDGKLKTGAAAQLSQSGYYALQCPYIVFGLGRTPNFVDQLTIGMPRAKNSPVRRHSWPSIIPNSQMIVIPYPPNNPNEWTSKLLVTPSKLVLLTGLCMLGLCVVLALVIMVLHLLEKRADQKEKREDAHKFHFDAM